MSVKNFQAVIPEIGKKTTGEKSLPRIKISSSPNRLPKLDVKKFAAFAYNTEESNCMNKSKIPRPQMTASYSYNEILKNGKDKTKRAPCMIPRLKSRKQGEIEKVKFVLSSKVEFSKEEIDKILIASCKKSGINLIDQKSEFILPSKEISESSLFCEAEDGSWKQNLVEKISLTLKSCQNLVDVKEEESDTSYKDAQESVTSHNVKTMSWQGQEVKELARQVRDPKDTKNDEHEAEKQQKIIRNLYETIKNTGGLLFDNLKLGFKTSPKKIIISETGIFQSNLTKNEITKKAKSKSTYELAPHFSSIQDQYEFTLKEISNIWKNAMSLINCVKDHTVQFVEENNVSIDKEQLTLEAEMLQLATDFAISYSKLKTDFLIKSVRKSLNVKDLRKSELETFMDSKTYAAVYNNEDLAAMARTVHDLNLSVLKGEDFEFE